MDLTSIVRKPGRSEKRTFEWPKCNFIETKVVSGPLGSEQVNCLTDNIRSPHE
jgi:hypothetical protein